MAASPAPVQRLALDYDCETAAQPSLRADLEANVCYQLGPRLLDLLQPGKGYLVRVKRQETPGREWYGDIVHVRYVVEVQEQPPLPLPPAEPPRP